jgi:3-dehydroquinate synthase
MSRALSFGFQGWNAWRQILQSSASSDTIFVMPCNRRTSYPVVLAPSVFDSPVSPLIEMLSGRRVLLVTTPTVYELHGESFRKFGNHQSLNKRTKIDILVIPVTEKSKDYAAVERVCRKSMDIGLDRRSVLLAVGGGVCTDITSYAAALIRRGIGCIRIPTTLLGQVDAGIGVKTAVNFNGKKAYLGCFYAPMAVILDPTLLRTLPIKHFQLGLAEIIKIALIGDADLFFLVESEWPRLCGTSLHRSDPTLLRVIESSAKKMLEELAPNLFEDQTFKRLVDAGHTFTPLIEAASDFAIHHGEAVAIDLCLSATIAAVAGILEWKDRFRLTRLIHAIGLPTFTPLLTEELCERALIEAGYHRGGQSNLVLPDRIGSGIFIDGLRDLPEGTIKASLGILSEEVKDGSTTRSYQYFTTGPES